MARILYIHESYPELSETYIDCERRQVEERAETFLLSLEKPYTFDPNHLPYSHVSSVFGWGIRRAARAFRPDIVHAHWLTMVRPAIKAARACDVPWTVRTHSFDLLERPLEKIEAEVKLCNASDCAGVLAFPFARPILLRAGLREDKLIDAPPVVDVERFDDLSPNGPGVIHMGANKKKKNFPDFIKLSTMVPERPFSLYPLSRGWEGVRDIVDALGGRVDVYEPVPNTEMLPVWKRHAWLVYTGRKDAPSNGWPMAVCEAWAAGVGVCVQRVRDDLDDYLAGCGYLFDDIEEVPALIAEAPSEDMRRRGRERALEFDIRRHMHLLYDAWAEAGVSL